MKDIFYRTMLLDAKEFSDEAFKAMQDALKDFGIHTYEDPRCEGTDSFGIILTREKMEGSQLAQLVAEE